MSDAEASRTPAVAIVGLSGRFPGARDVHQFWTNLANGVESITQLGEEDLEAGDPSLWRQPNFVKARAILDDVDQFDAPFWGMLPREAELTDPQQRVFLECAWQAIEDAGYDPTAYKGAIGVFAGCSVNTYFLLNLCSDREFVDEFTRNYQVGSYQTLVGNHIDFLATKIAYKLNLRGPAFTISSGCSTSLVAVAQATQNLLSYQCDMALAGGVSISFPQKRGYLYQAGGMVSADGHCRTFDADSQGTVFGSGAGVVLLKRLEDALADGDHIYAVITGFALNNDGSAKVGFAAPSVEGQAEVIAMAQAAAGVPAESISYLEAHGTATPLGDPIEIAAASRAFRASTKAKGFCAIGTAKTNVGHLDVAAGVTGLIKTVLSLKEGKLLPSLHFTKPNPNLDLENSPFYVNTELKEWKQRNGQPRRAGVSAFGVGGTNAHVIVEEAPQQHESSARRDVHLLVFSAKTRSALRQTACNLEDHVRKQSDCNLADVAHTLQVGRQPFEHRGFVIARNAAGACQSLQSVDLDRASSVAQVSKRPAVVFMFPGQGSQYVDMGRELYSCEPEYRKWIDECSALVRPLLSQDLREVMYADKVNGEVAQRLLTSTSFAQPALFATEFALAKLWISWGIRPDAMIGHSIGEFVAACLGGVFSLSDGLRLVATRGRLMQDLPGGSMLAVRLPESQVVSQLPPTVSIAAINSPALCVVSGPTADIEALEKSFTERGTMTRRLHTSHAFHSSMMDPVIDPFLQLVKEINLRRSSISIVSAVSRDWLSEEHTTSPEYWARHLREPVRFSDALAPLSKLGSAVLVECGPGSTLNTLVLQNPAAKEKVVVNSLPDSSRIMSDTETMLTALGKIWCTGVQPDWKSFHKGETLRRVSLPTYPFERKRYWISAKKPAIPGSADPSSVTPEESSVSTDLMRDSDSSRAMPEVGSQELAQPEVSMTDSTRREHITQKLLAMFEELSGISHSELDPAATFTELGFDSLFLTQATQELHTKFGLKITFRQLLDTESTVQALATYIESKLPAETKAVTPPAARGDVAPPVTAIPAAIPALATTSAVTINARLRSEGPNGKLDSNFVNSLMNEQLRTMSELMSRQLETLARAGVQQSAPQNSAPVAVQTTATSLSANPSVSQVLASSTKEEPKAFGPFKPLSKGQVAVTQRQTEHIAALIERYARKTAKSKQLTQKYRQVMADPRVVAGFRSQWKEIVYPLVTDRSEGSKLYDVDGNEYIDILNGYGPTVFGHKPKFVVDAVQKQLELGFEIGPMSPLAGQVAELISEFTGMERVAFCNTGSEAVVCAMRIARTVTGRSKVVMFTGDYHGMFDEVLVRGLNQSGKAPRSLPIAPGIPPSAAENVIVLEYGKTESLEYIRNHAGEFAAIIVEPVQSRHPNLQPKEFLESIRKITLEAGTALIFDEVVTGFRTHPGGAQAIFGIRADIATYGKVIGGGLPIGIIAGKRQFMDALDGGQWQFGDDSFPEVGVTFFAGTFVRHPLALAATYSVLQHLKQEGPQLQEGLNERTRQMVARINVFLQEREAPLKIENFASIFFFAFPSDQRFGSLFYYHMRERGIHVQEGFPCFLTTSHSDADVERIVTAFQDSIVAMQADGLLPGKSEEISAVSMSPVSAQVSAASLDAHISEAPLTEVQMEIWLSAQLGDEPSCAFNESLTLQLHGPLDEVALREAVQELVARHDALRATFSVTGDRQYFNPEFKVEMPLLDLSTLNRSERDQRLVELKALEARTPFDLVNGPVVRFKLLRFSPEEHAVLFTGHHIVCDGWSVNVILDELGKLYSQKKTGIRVALPQPLSFGAYANSQQEFSRKQETAEIEKYWLNQFVETPPDLDLPTDRPRQAMRSYEGATYRTQISADAYQSIKRAGAKLGCTLFVTLLTGFDALLARLTNQSDLVVGIPTAGQSLLDGTTLVGHCVNFLPLRAQITEGMLFKELLSKQKRILLDAYEHQTYTYGTLVRKLALKRDPSRLPLMEVQFNLERVGTDAEFSGLRVQADANAKAFVNFDLFLNVVESETGLLLDCDYNTALYDEATIARWMRHYETLLRGFVANPDQPISKLPLLTNQEKQQILVEWNATETEFPRDKGVHELFELQATKTPNAVAAVFEDKQITYADLNQKANQLAQHLLKVGVTARSTVAIYLDRSLEMMIALLGVLKAGAAYLPLDPNYPKARIDFILEEAKVQAVLTQSHLGTTLPETAARVLCLDSDWQLIARESGGKPAISILPEDLAYVIYTSGSTGKPKGVEVPHRAVVNLLTSMARVPGMDEGDVIVAVTTLSFDIAVLELFLPLTVGARLVIVSREIASDPDQLTKALTRNRATVMQATPATWRLLLEANWTGQPLRKILCGGEALPRDLADRLLALQIPLWNMYGPTETTIWSSATEVKRGEPKVTIGPPIANTQFYIVDSCQQPTAIGVPGELCIAGAGLALGYYKRPELTSAKFVSNPFSDTAKMYRTGDLARYLPDGRIEFLGRLDNQVKLRGFRIELGEIEAVLNKTSGIRESAVMVREDVPGDRRLVAYYVLSSGNLDLAVADLRREVSHNLPEYMVPSAFVKMECLPRTPNRKLDTRSLPKPDPTQSLSSTAAQPTTPEERKMAEIWAEVLKVREVGITDNLFELGADSLHVFQIVARANKANIKVTAKLVLQHRNIAAIMREVAKASGNGSSSTAASITAVSREKYKKTTTL